VLDRYNFSAGPAWIDGIIERMLRVLIDKADHMDEALLQ
jgi:hypothetical protein